MSLLLMDSFDHFTDTADAQLKWGTGSGASLSTSTVRTGLNSILLGGTGNYLQTTFANYDTLVAGVAMYPTANGVSDFFLFYDGATIQITLRLLSNNTLAVYRAGSTQLAVSTESLTLNTWQYVEIKINFHNSTGYVIVNVNEEEWINSTGLDTSQTGNEYANTFRLRGGNFTCYYDDFYLCNTLGTDNNDFLGDVKIEAILPDGAGDYSQWTPLSGSNYQMVDEVSVDDDTTYNYTTISGAMDNFSFDDMALASGTILGIQSNLFARKDEAGARYLRFLYTVSGIDYLYSGASLGNSYAYFRDIREKNPYTNANWTISGVNGLRAGYEMES